MKGHLGSAALLAAVGSLGLGCGRARSTTPVAPAAPGPVAARDALPRHGPCRDLYRPPPLPLDRYDCVAATPDYRRTVLDLYQQARFAEAGDCAVAGFEVQQSDGFLFNAGTMYQQAGLDRLAAYYYRRFLDTDPPAPMAARTREQLDRLAAPRP